MRFAMTARTIARQRGEGEDINEMTQRNVEKVTRYRPNGEEELEQMVERLNDLKVGERDNSKTNEARWGGRI
jgi:large subunit ribosomal protein L17